MSFREIKRQARRVVQDIMRHPIVFFQNPNDATTGVDCYARIHRDNLKTGGVKGLAVASILALEETPKIIFYKSDMSDLGLNVIKGVVISVLENEVYAVDGFLPSDDEMIIVEAIRLPRERAQLYRAPDHV